MYVYIHPKSILSDSKHSHPTINLCDLPAPRAELQELSRHIEAAAVVSTSIGWEKLRVTAENDGSTYGLVQWKPKKPLINGDKMVINIYKRLNGVIPDL